MSEDTQEVSSAHSTDEASHDGLRNPNCDKPVGKEQIQKEPLDPQYVAGFIDGEGCFSISVGKHKTLKLGKEVRPEFSIELRSDDREILERILITIGCGRIYDLSYDRYDWHPHVKYKIGSRKDMINHLFPFLDETPLQAKKRKDYRIFKQIIFMMEEGKHLEEEGFQEILSLREEIRKNGKKAKNYQDGKDSS